MNVLLLTGSVEQDDAQLLSDEAHWLELEGIRAEVACFNAAEAIPPDLRLDEVPALESHWRREFELRRWTRRHHVIPEVLHVRGARAVEAGLVTAETWQRPYLVELQGTLPNEARFRVSSRWFRGLLVSNPDVAEDLARGLGLDLDWIRVLPPGIRPPEPVQPDLRPPVTRDVKVVGIEVDATDGPSVLTVLRAARRLLDQGHDLEFVISGTAGAEAEVRRAIDHFRLADRTTLAEPSAVGSAFWTVFDVYCRASGVTDAGLDVEHAMIHRVPVVVPDARGLRGWIEHETSGLMVPPGDAAALADAIGLLLANPAWARRIGQCGAETILRNCDPLRRARDLARLYRQIASNEPELVAKS